MTTIGFLGAGKVARALATGWARAGHSIIVGTRRNEPPPWTKELNGVAGGTLEKAAQSAAVVVNALPGSAALEVVAGLESALSGKILIDVANAVDVNDMGFAVALRYAPTSLAEEIQAVLPSAFVVKTLNTMHESVMAAPNGLAFPPMAFLSGNEEAAKATVAGLLADLGWPAFNVIDLGDIRSARAPEAFILTVAPLVRALGPVAFALSVAR
jgi:8-hydroxy-5-deazaflavin:NADPH oxidoreductase